MSIPFLIAAALLLLLSLAWLLRPLLRRTTSGPSRSRQALNTTIYRDQLAELERDRSAGSIAAADFEQARAELQRRLLQDAAVAGEVPAAPSTTHPERRTALLLLLLLPLSAGLLDAWLGNPDAMLPAAMRPATAQHEISAGQIDEMIGKLAERLEKNPQDTQGWAMLGRSYKALGRFDEAEKAFIRAGDMVDNDPALLTEYADLLAARANSPRQADGTGAAGARLDRRISWPWRWRYRRLQSPGFPEATLLGTTAQTAAAGIGGCQIPPRLRRYAEKVVKMAGALTSL